MMEVESSESHVDKMAWKVLNLFQYISAWSNSKNSKGV